jgi:hypothetical protein
MNYWKNNHFIQFLRPSLPTIINFKLFKILKLEFDLILIFNSTNMLIQIIEESQSIDSFLQEKTVQLKMLSINPLTKIKMGELIIN